MAQIILAFDGSDGALSAATSLSHWDLHGSSVMILTVLPASEWPSRQVARMRETLARTLRRRGAAPELALRSGVPSDEIRDLAVETGADLIVLGPRKRPALSHFLLGSVSKAVISKAPCSVLVGRLSLSTERAMVVVQEADDLSVIQRGWERLPLPRELEVFLVGLRREFPVLSEELPREVRHRWPEIIPKRAELQEASRVQALLQKGDDFFRGRAHQGLSLSPEGSTLEEVLKLERQVSPELIALRLNGNPDQNRLIAEARASVLLMR